MWNYFPHISFSLCLSHCFAFFLFYVYGLLAFKCTMYTQCPQRTERALDLLELELQMLLTTMWVLGIEPRSSGKAVSAETLSSPHGTGLIL